jgi:hypothetical protein
VSALYEAYSPKGKDDAPERKEIGTFGKFDYPIAQPSIRLGSKTRIKVVDAISGTIARGYVPPPATKSPQERTVMVPACRESQSETGVNCARGKSRGKRQVDVTRKTGWEAPAGRCSRDLLGRER